MYTCKYTCLVLRISQLAHSQQLAHIRTYVVNVDAFSNLYTCSDVDKIHDGIGDKIGLLIQWLATFVGGFVAAFATEWRLTLLLIAFAPLMVIAGFFMSKVCT